MNFGTLSDSPPHLHTRLCRWIFFGFRIKIFYDLFDPFTDSPPFSFPMLSKCRLLEIRLVLKFSSPSKIPDSLRGPKIAIRCSIIILAFVFFPKMIHFFYCWTLSCTEHSLAVRLFRFFRARCAVARICVLSVPNNTMETVRKYLTEDNERFEK